MTDALSKYDNLSVPADDLATAKRLALEMIAAERLVAEREQELAAANAALKAIKEDQLPKLMEELGLPDFTILDKETGARIQIAVGEIVRVSISKGGSHKGRPTTDNRPAAFAFFRSIGLGALIKKEVRVNVGLRGDNVVKDMVESIREKYPDVDTSVEEWIESSTLTAEIKKRRKDGKFIPDAITVFPQREAKATVS